jgi:hypothetical protein
MQQKAHEVPFYTHPKEPLNFEQDFHIIGFTSKFFRRNRNPMSLG